jgi:hypothetical protein
MAVAANEPKFYQALVEALGLSPDDLPRSWTRAPGQA